MYRLAQQPRNPHANREDRWSNESKRTVLNAIPPARVAKQQETNSTFKYHRFPAKYAGSPCIY
jgi:hypothetical protein